MRSPQAASEDPESRGLQLAPCAYNVAEEYLEDAFGGVCRLSCDVRGAGLRITVATTA